MHYKYATFNHIMTEDILKNENVFRHNSMHIFLHISKSMWWVCKTTFCLSQTLALAKLAVELVKESLTHLPDPCFA